MPELFAAEHGSGGDPIVLLHGFGASHSAWDRVLAALSGARRLLVFDLPGHAASLAVPHGSAAIAARAVLAALKTRAIPRFHLVGHSMGGAAAALAALMQPAQA